MDAWTIIHITTVSLFLLSLLVKISLVIIAKYGLLEWYTRTFRITDMLLSLVFLGTGIFLWNRWNFSLEPTWFRIKLLLVVAAIPLGIIGIKKQSRLASLLTAGMFLYVFVLSLKRNFLIAD